MLQEQIEDIEILEKWLGTRKGSRVYLRVPRKGYKEKLVEPKFFVDLFSVEFRPLFHAMHKPPCEHLFHTGIIVRPGY